MARANLNIQQAIIDSFLAAQDSKNVRIIKIRIQGEDLVLEGAWDKQGSATEDFDQMLPATLSENEACFSLFSTSNNTESQQWILVAWVPDGCRVRDKMLYSSSREDLKRSLGLGYFKAEYGASEISDITWDQYMQSQRKDVDVSVLTESERLILEEKTVSASEVTASKASALGVIPFTLSDEVLHKFDEFKQGSCNWIEMTIEAEVIQLVSAKEVSSEGSLSQYLNRDNASFIAGKLPKDDASMLTFFVFSCPENVPIRTKMMMSSSKASVLAAAGQQEITFEKLFEIRDIDEIDDVLKPELGTAAAKGIGSNASSSAAALSHSKPQRPGKGKVRVAKFKADE